VGDADATDETMAASLAQGGGELIGGRYRILSLLGAGGMGSVYRVRDTELDEVVALKMLHRHIVSSPGALARFRQEVKLARKVTHRNVARTFDIGEHAGEKYLTMEYVDGESLSAVLRRRGAMPISDAIAVAVAVCEGLQAAHAAGVVHRDLKPDNILFAKDGRVLVTDFGIARGLSSDGASQTMGQTVGTPAYMAPEQVEARPDIDGRADVYALGAVLFEMVTGVRAWGGEGAMQVAAARLHEPPPDPRARRPELPEALAQVIVRSLARAPGDRFASASELAHALAALAGAVATAPQPPRSPSLSPVPSVQSLSSTPRSTTGDLSMAVLPLRNLGAPEEAYLADGLTEDLIDALSMTHGVKVRARGAVMEFKGQEADPRVIGQRLEVRVVVEGSVRKLGEQVRVTVRLLNVDDGFQLWTRRFDRSLGDLLTVNEEAAQAIAQALSARVGAVPRAAVQDPVAVELYLRARQLSEGEVFTRPESLVLFEQALARTPEDPTILSAYAAALSRVEPSMGALSLKNESARRSREVAERAVAVAPHLGEPWLALALALRAESDAIGAIRAVKRSLRNAPSLASAQEMAGSMLIEIGPVDEGVEILRRARWTDPQMFRTAALLVRAYDLAGRVEERDQLIAELRGGPRPDFIWLARMRQILWHRLPLELVLPPKLPAMPMKLMNLLYSGIQSSPSDPVWRAEFRKFIDAAAMRPIAKRFPCQLMAEVEAYLGNPTLALDWIAEASEHEFADIVWIDRVPIFESLRSDPRFPALRATIAARAAVLLAAWREP
jgi:serine/threonine-protein kinase